MGHRWFLAWFASGLLLAGTMLGWGNQERSRQANLLPLHLNAASNAGTCVSCHGPKDRPDSVDPQTGWSERTLDPQYPSVHVLHLTNPLLKLGCTDCHLSVDLTPNRSAAQLSKQVHPSVCGTCHNPPVNEAHAGYEANQCVRCHAARHDSAPRFIDETAVTGAACTKCHGGVAFFAARTTQPRPSDGTGIIAGKVMREDGTLVAGITVEAVREGRVVAMGTSTAELVNGANYRLYDVPAGYITVRIANAGQRAERQVYVGGGGEIPNVDLVVEPILTLEPGYHEFSLPYTYRRLVPQDAAAILGVSPTTLKLAAVVGAETKEDYAVYPTGAARRLEPGRGYQILLEQPLAVVVSGEEVTDPLTPVALEAGWNLIGNPYLDPVPWYRVRVQRADGRVLSLDQAVRSGLLGRVLWVYNEASRTYERATRLEPFRAYWIRATAGCILLIPRP